VEEQKLRQVGMLATQYICIREMFGSNFGQDSGYSDNFRDFPEAH
jgi:hypothetical protein